MRIGVSKLSVSVSECTRACVRVRVCVCVLLAVVGEWGAGGGWFFLGC